MKAILVMMWFYLKLGYRIRVAFFFTVIFSMAFFFLYAIIFAGSNGERLSLFMGPLITFLLVSNALFGFGGQLVTMREMDILRSYRVAPVSAWQLLISRLFGSYLLLLPVLVAQFVLAVWLFNMPLKGSVVNIFVVLTVGNFALLGVGMLVPSVVDTMQSAQVLNQILFIVLVFLSGATIPLAVMPHAIQRIALFLPSTSLVIAFQGIMVKGDSIWTHWPEMAFLFLTFVIAVSLGTRLFRWDKKEHATARAKLQGALILLLFLLCGLFLNLSGDSHFRNISGLTASRGRSPNQSWVSTTSRAERKRTEQEDKRP